MLSRPEIRPAKLLSNHSYQHPNKLLINESFYSVPFDHFEPDGRQLRIFCRTAEPFAKAVNPSDEKKDSQLPLITYIQGGPGFGCAHPASMPATEILLAKGYKMVYIDHRGMGLSNTVTAATLQKEGDDAAQAEYLTHFRAPYAVCDLEAIRMAMTAEYPENARQWSIMGQSYGGFVSTSYLSMYPGGLRESFIFGGLPPVSDRSPDNVIRRFIPKLKQRNNLYYEKFAGDVSRLAAIVSYLKKHDGVSMPDGGVLSPGRLLEMGIGLGMSEGFIGVHDKIVRASNDLDMFGELTRPTLEALADSTSFDVAVIYALLHEPIYAQGEATNFAFDRMVAEDADFDYTKERSRYEFTGEMVFSRVYDDYSELRSLKKVAQIIHEKKDWPDLYDTEQLKRNEVPVYAAVYVNDLYVAMESALETASIIKGCKVFMSNQLHHNAVRAKAKEVVEALFALRDDVID
ncbi:Proline iminopeptidase [Cyphellophora attinorum]|uniref:Proline iminopeptidase n=1 Tax=Cyphellophora attinorum TaxID=1664694 RepID=A0A0N1P1N3_9EURO|nr:Proline iminopeptidase [Phialophora attinorum]KPI45473.1 Proline iminopeptidase [Phialophora attinorum]